MKKLFFAMLFLATSALFAQVEEVLVFSDTCGNSQTKTAYVDVPREASEVIFVVHAKGEADIDSMEVFEGWISKNGGKAYVATKTQGTTMTINVDSAAYGFQAGATLSDFEGANTYKVNVISASSGNDSTDPNRVEIYAQFYK